MNPSIDIESANKILLEFDSIMKKFNIQYFLLFGTCLEFTREGGFIQSTRDIDIGVKYNNSIPFRTLIREMSNCGYVLERSQPPRAELRKFIGDNTFLISFYSFRKNNVPLDIYVCFKDDVNNRYIAGRKYIILPEHLENMVDKQWNGITLKMPNEKYLEYSYGDWKTPNPECSGPIQH